MRAVVQRVSRARVTVGNQIVGEMAEGCSSCSVWVKEIPRQAPITLQTKSGVCEFSKMTAGR